MAAHALAATHAAGLDPRVISVPRASASPAMVAHAASAGYVSPLYTGAPAPMGLAYYGLSEGSNGAVVPTILNTTRLMAQVDLHGTGIQPADLFQSSPDSFGVQLNAVLTNVTLFGHPGYSFWTQNVIEYYAGAHFLVLVTNVWNFSGGPITQNALYTHGPYGTSIYGTLGYYYAEAVLPFPVTGPFNVSLFMNSTVAGGRDAMSFTVAVNGPTVSFAAPYDYVVFNSTTPGGPKVTSPSNYTANGYSYNALGLTNDFEVILGGPGGGSHADIGTANATLGLSYWDAAHNSYHNVPAAFNYGGETGETVSGVSIAWAQGSGGPAGLNRYATVSTGPSILRGLWNAGAAPGAEPVTIAVTPSNAWFVVTPVNGTKMLHNFLSSESVAASGAFGDTLWLTPGVYKIAIGLSDYRPVTKTVSVSHAMTISINLKWYSNAGVYTPLWAFSNAQLAAISNSGSGTTTSPYHLVNNQYAPLPAVFGLYNDYVFPVFPGIFLQGTTASVSADHSASFTTRTSVFQYPGQSLPATNQLQMWFWNVSSVALTDSAISGWFGSSTYYPIVFDTFNVIFYASSGNLVAHNNFTTGGEALLLFSGGSIFGAVNIGGGNNTVWGNWFSEAATPTSTLSVAPMWSGLNVGLGIEIAEQNDLIYNNYVTTPTTAWLLPLNLYSGTGFSYTATWNISKQHAWVTHYAANFPWFPLRGSITGSWYQGGNFWWDYGVNNTYNGAVNPVGVLPYDENATTLVVYVYGPSYYYSTYIYNGGDYVPLV
jgi:thermopsin